MTLSRALRIAALLMFFATAVGVGPLTFGTITVTLLPLGLACWVAADLNKP